jgi:type 1 fimbriae regulatory protein FimB/type 1 fimbriae regulatory protein FimE
MLGSDHALFHHGRLATYRSLAHFAGHDTRALQAYHRNIPYTVRCTELMPNRFRDFWR